MLWLSLTKGQTCTPRPDTDRRPCTGLVGCMCGHAEVVKALLENGADVHAETSDGETPLHVANEESHHDIAAMLRA